MNEVEFDKAQKLLRPFVTKNIRIATREFLFTVVLLWGGIILSYYAFRSSTIWMLYFSVPVTVAFMCRSYVIEHDCGHQSFVRKEKWNDFLGNIVGFGIMIPYSMWKFVHNSHHMHVGNLSMRNFNPEVWTMTIQEFKNASLFKKTMYRTMRSRFARLVIVPTVNYGLGCRLIHPKFSKKVMISVLVHNVFYIALFWFVISQIGFYQTFIIYFLPLILFFGIAAYTFYGQHQFEDTYWRTGEEWSWKEATTNGATDLQAPSWFRWLIGNVVYHTAHHIHFNIPFYKLHDAQKALNEEFDFKKISITQVWKLMGMKLWDPEKRKLVGFKEALKS